VTRTLLLSARCPALSVATACMTSTCSRSMSSGVS